MKHLCRPEHYKNSFLFDRDVRFVLLTMDILPWFGLMIAAGGVGYWCLRQRAIDKTTVLNEIPHLGNGRKDGKRLAGTVVIAGGR